MIAIQRHRGPDGEGFFDSPYGVLGHCRLAILDLSAAGAQPMADHERRYWITFNGEIYNYLELGEELAGRGHVFRSRCDTEVLLAAYREWGRECLLRLRGMFAFAIWDSDERRLFAARDRFGIKPFHYAVRGQGECLAFASELKALLGFVPTLEINESLAGAFLAWNLLDHASSETMVKGILRLPAAHYLQWSAGGQPEVARYWDLEVTSSVRSSAAEQKAYTAEFRELFLESVALHLRSDVPIGSCLSGGLDSSSIVCAVTAELHARRIAVPGWQHTFSATFHEPAFDERRYVDAVTAATGTTNHQVTPDGARLLDDLETWLWHQDEPVGGFGVYSQFCVGRLASEHGIKVLLDGQGADEQLLGYRKFILAYGRQLVHSGHPFHALREAICFATGTPLGPSAVLEGMRYVSEWIGDARRLWPRDVPVRPPALGLSPPLAGRIHADITAFSLPVLLRFEDRNTMAFGIEARVPFLDHVLAECVARMPLELRLRGGWTKRVLRDALKDLLPPTVHQRRSKLGFDTPDAQWVRGPLTGWLHEMLERPEHLARLVDPCGIKQLLHLHRAKRASARATALLLRLALFEQWGRLFLTRSVTLTSTAPIAGALLVTSI
jgi:asparagine synthase (glutamine-hydrolysing)